MSENALDFAKIVCYTYYSQSGDYSSPQDKKLDR